MIKCKFDERLIGLIIGGIAIIATVQSQVGSNECSNKQNNALEILSLATEIKSVAKYHMNIPDVCISYTGRADLVLDSERLNPIPREILDETNSSLKRLGELTALLSSKASYFYSTLSRESLFVPKNLQEIAQENISGSTLKASIYIANFQNNIHSFTEQCTESKKYHPLWAQLDTDIESLSSELAILSMNCSRNTWGKIFQTSLIALLIAVIAYLYYALLINVPMVLEFLINKFVSLVSEASKKSKRRRRNSRTSYASTCGCCCKCDHF